MDFEHAVNVFEFSETEGRISRQADKASRAYYAIKQTNEAIPGLIENMPSLTPANDVPNVIVPIVVTTANLWVTDYDAADINKATGDIDPNKLNLKSRDWVLYSYPLTFNEQVQGKNKGNAMVPLKRSTFVVTALALPSFITEILGDFRSYFDHDSYQS